MLKRVISFVYINFVIGSTVYGQNWAEFATSREIADTSDNKHLNQCLSKYLIPRVVGSSGHNEVAQYTKSELESLGFKTDIDRFVARTPVFGNLTFSNIIGLFNPNADSFLTLACHYDSKYFEDNPSFVGAIDSAVPCCLMLNLAKTLLPFMEDKLRGRSDIGLQLIFFDGEEAFQDWSNHDSLYGSRHLANKLSKKVVQLHGSNKQIRDIDRIEVMVLLDLIGAPNTKFHSFYQNTHRLHESLVKIERFLDQNHLLEGDGDFQIMRSSANGVVDDDHRPFLEKNVPVLHIIPTKFPRQWHKPSDTAENLHFPSIRNMNKILRIFVYKYLSKHAENPQQFQFRLPSYGFI